MRRGDVLANVASARWAHSRDLMARDHLLSVEVF